MRNFRPRRIDPADEDPMLDPLTTPIGYELATEFHIAVGAADAWYAAGANTSVTLDDSSIAWTCQNVIGFAGTMPEDITDVLCRLAKELHTAEPASMSYTDGARSLLIIHRELLQHYSPIPG